MSEFTLQRERVQDTIDEAYPLLERHFVMGVMTELHAGTKGFSMLSRIPARQCRVAARRYGLAREFFHCKAYVILAAISCVNTAATTIWMRRGSAWLFENRVPHSVVNDPTLTALR